MSRWGKTKSQLSTLSNGLVVNLLKRPGDELHVWSIKSNGEATFGATLLEAPLACESVNLFYGHRVVPIGHGQFAIVNV